jgi:hypothetical protein
MVKKKSQSQPMAMKNSVKTRFLTTSLRKIIFDVIFVYGRKIKKLSAAIYQLRT